MDLAEPSIMARAASTVCEFRSACFFSAISRIWARVTLPTKPRPVVLEPDLMLAAFLRKKVTGGCFISKVKLRSA
jgi:hypothetical protein